MEPLLSGNFIRNQNLILNSLMPALMPEVLACFSNQRKEIIKQLYWLVQLMQLKFLLSMILNIWTKAYSLNELK